MTTAKDGKEISGTRYKMGLLLTQACDLSTENSLTF